MAGWDQVQKIVGAVLDPIGWLSDSIFRGPLSTPLQLLEPLLGQPLHGSAQLYSVWHSIAAAASGLVAVASLARGLRIALSPDSRPASVLVEVAVRAGVTVGLVQLSYEALLEAYRVSSSLALALLQDLLSQVGAADLSSWLNAADIAHVSGVLKLALFAAALYVAVLLVVARLLMLFSIVTAPLVIPLFAYSERAEVLTWWGRLTLGALLAPLVSSVLLGVTALVASLGGQVLPGAPALGATIAVVAGLLLLGHALRHLTLHTFHIGHGMTTAGVALGVMAARTTVAAATPGAAPAAAAGSVYASSSTTFIFISAEQRRRWAVDLSQTREEAAPELNARPRLLTAPAAGGDAA